MKKNDDVQNVGNSGKTPESSEVVMLLGEKRERTTLNLKCAHMDALAEQAKDRGLNKTAIIDDALETALRQYNNTEIIDAMLTASGDFWFERSLTTVTAHISPEEATNLSAHQKAYLYNKLKDTTDRQRVFKALGLQNDLDEIDALNKMLDASRRIDEEEVSFNITQLANEIASAIKINLSNIQVKHLQLTVGIEATQKIQERVPDKFPKNDTFKPDDKKTTTDDADALPLDLETEVTS